MYTYIQVINNHVYVPLLLRLANDVEENPGPKTINDVVDPTYTVNADFNQGNELKMRAQHITFSKAIKAITVRF